MIINCDRCGVEYEIDETLPDEIWGTCGEAYKQSRTNPHSFFWCHKCIEETPDAWPLIESGIAIKEKIEPIN